MDRPTPTTVYHFTHVNNIASIAANGLGCDANVAALSTSVPPTAIAHQHIKDRRKGTMVPVPPGGRVSDYVPFYFAPRSPMLYAIHMGGVESYDGGQDPVVYLASDVDRLMSLGLQVVATDRNAVLSYAEFRSTKAGYDDLIDWHLMRQTMWNNTVQEPDRKERRMAECLVHNHVPWAALTGIHVRTRQRRDQVEGILADVDSPPVTVSPSMYF